MSRRKLQPFVKESSLLINHFSRREMMKPARVATRLGFDRSFLHRILDPDPKLCGYRLPEGRVSTFARICRLSEAEENALRDALERDESRASGRYVLPKSCQEIENVPDGSVTQEILTAFRRYHFTLEIAQETGESESLLADRYLQSDSLGRLLFLQGVRREEKSWNDLAFHLAIALRDEIHVVRMLHRDALYMESVQRRYQASYDALLGLIPLYERLIKPERSAALLRDIAQCIYHGFGAGSPPDSVDPFLFLDESDRIGEQVNARGEFGLTRLMRAEILVAFGDARKALRVLEISEPTSMAGDEIGLARMEVMEAKIRVSAGDSGEYVINLLDKVERRSRRLELQADLRVIEGLRKRLE